MCEVQADCHQNWTSADGVGAMMSLTKAIQVARVVNYRSVALRASQPRNLPKQSSRQLSSLGNPMFPERPRPELESFEDNVENSKKAKNSSGPGEKKHVIDILADHGGKIALVIFGGIAALLYTYYLSGKDRNRIEDDIAEAVSIEPYEIQELRYFNQITEQEYQQIVDQAKRTFTSGQASYSELMRFLKNDLVLTESKDDSVDDLPRHKAVQSMGNGRAKVQLHSTHLFDRMVMFLALRKHSPSPAASTDNSSNSSTTASAATSTAPIAWADEPLSLDLLLVMLSLAMVPRAESRVQALYRLASAGMTPTNSDTVVASTGGENEAFEGNTANSENSIAGLNREAVVALVEQLIATDQVPPSKQTIESGVRWPVKLHRRRTALDMIRQYELNKKLPEPMQSYDINSFRELLLGYQVCAWGECYNRDRDR